MLDPRMYIDESGDSTLKNVAEPRFRFLSLSGVIVSQSYVAEKMHPEMEYLKRWYFGSHPDEPVILHRTDLERQQYPFHALQDRCVEYNFNYDLLAYLHNWEYTVITVCLDKKTHVEKYGDNARDPYGYCLCLLLERFNYWLKRRNSRGDVIVEGRQGKADRILKEAFRTLREDGTKYVDPTQFQTSLINTELKVRPKSANIAGLQLADLIAQPSRSEILHEQGLLGRELAPFTQQIAGILADKYDASFSGRIDGYGKKFI